MKTTRYRYRCGWDKGWGRNTAQGKRTQVVGDRTKGIVWDRYVDLERGVHRHERTSVAPCRTSMQDDDYEAGDDVEQSRERWEKLFRQMGGGLSEDGKLTDDQVSFADYVEKYLCRAARQKEAVGKERKQVPFSPSSLRRYFVAPALDSPEPAPHLWPTYKKELGEREAQPQVKALKQHINEWKSKKKAENIKKALQRTEKLVELETSFMDNSAVDQRIQYSDLRGWKRHEFSDQEIWDTVTRHGQTPTADDVIRLQGTTHVQMYTLDQDEVIDYNETVRPLSEETNLQGVFKNYCPEWSQVVFHGREKNFSNHDPVLYDLEALGRLRWPEDFKVPTGEKDNKSAKGKGDGKSDVQEFEELDLDTDEMDMINESGEIGGAMLDSLTGKNQTFESKSEFANDDSYFVSDDATDNEDNMTYESSPNWNEEESDMF